MRKQFIKNIKGLIQAGEDLPVVLRGAQMSQLATIENAYLAIEDNEVIAYGPMNEWPGITDWRDVEVIDATNCFVLPAFIDSHTHTVFAASREEEFVDRIHGLSYEEIAAKGGGILNSANKLNQMSEDALYEAAFARIQKIIDAGTGALEIKSGYGLSVEGELKMLRVIQTNCSYPNQSDIFRRACDTYRIQSKQSCLHRSIDQRNTTRYCRRKPSRLHRCILRTQLFQHG